MVINNRQVQRRTRNVRKMEKMTDDLREWNDSIVPMDPPTMVRRHVPIALILTRFTCSGPHSHSMMTVDRRVPQTLWKDVQ